MKNDTAVTGSGSAGARAAALRMRLDTLRATRRRGPFGLPELMALAFAALLLLAAVLSYLFLLVPQQSRRSSLETERSDLQRLVASQRDNIGSSQDTAQRVSDILSSLERFETGRLGVASSGSKTLYEELNRLITKNGLRISGGINFTQLQEAVPGAETAPRARRQGTSEESGQRVVQSIFPGIGVTLTVEGTYPNLRRFIRDIEGDRRQFVVVNTVELEGVSDTNAAEQVAPPVSNGAMPGAPQPQAQAPTRGALVSLRLDMATYFRRAAAASEAQ
ncbi:MAG TPA: GspMb/PilO family protein [Pyrinomonadaceae bacterium]